MVSFVATLRFGAFAVTLCILFSMSGVQCGGHGWDLGGYAGHGDHYDVSHHKVAKISYVKTPIVSTHYVKKPVVSYISKPVKSVHYVKKPIVSLHSVPVITKTSHHSYGHGW